MFVKLVGVLISRSVERVVAIQGSSTIEQLIASKVVNPKQKGKA